MSISNQTQTPARVRVAGLLSAGVFLRLAAIPSAVGDVDSVNFARALLRYNPLHQAPHLPGYPTLVLLARPLASAGVPDPLALALPGVLLWCLGGWLLFRGLSQLLDMRFAFGALAFASLSPGLILISGWPASDGLGLSLLAATIGLCASAIAAPGQGRALFFAGGALAALLGARLSWWPLALSLISGTVFMLRYKGMKTKGAKAQPDTNAELGAAVAGFGLVALALAGFLFSSISPKAFALGVLSFAKGHTLQWGHTAFAPSVPSTRFTAAAISFGRAIGGAQSSAWALLALSLGGLAVGVWRHPRRPALLAAIAWLTLPYLVWALLFQNVHKPRHFAPLLLLMGGVIAWGLPEVRRAGTVAVGALLALSLMNVRVQGGALPPATALVKAAAQRVPPRNVQIIAGPEARVFEHFAPGFRAWRAPDAAATLRQLRWAKARGATVYLSSGAPGVETLKAKSEIARVEAQGHFAPRNRALVLYRAQEELHADR